MASASSAMVSGRSASARISRARMPRERVWEGEAWAGAICAAAPALGVMLSILGVGAGRLADGSCVARHLGLAFHIGISRSTIEQFSECGPVRQRRWTVGRRHTRRRGSSTQGINDDGQAGGGDPASRAGPRFRGPTASAAAWAGSPPASPSSLSTGPTKRHGITVNSFTSVSMDPPLVLVSIARTAKAHDELAGRPFAVNILGAEQRLLALHFAGRQGPEPRWVEGAAAPRLSRGARLL